jgi:hypothetical protein
MVRFLIHHGAHGAMKEKTISLTKARRHKGVFLVGRSRRDRRVRHLWLPAVSAVHPGEMPDIRQPVVDGARQRADGIAAGDGPKQWP